MGPEVETIPSHVGDAIIKQLATLGKGLEALVKQNDDNKPSTQLDALIKSISTLHETIRNQKTTVVLSDDLLGKIKGPAMKWEDLTDEQKAELRGETPSIESLKEMIRGLIPEAQTGNPGAPGQPGAAGSPGKTPVKGVDYFTEGDIESLAKSLSDTLQKSSDSYIEGRLKSIIEDIRQKMDDLEKYDSKFMTQDGVREQFDSFYKTLERIRETPGGVDSIFTLPGFDFNNATVGQTYSIVRTKDGVQLVVATTGSGADVDFTGAIDDSNVTFGKPTGVTLKAVVINGQRYKPSSKVGNVLVWTVVGDTVTTQFPVGAGGDIYGQI